jgi:hypothetical protein
MHGATNGRGTEWRILCAVKVSSMKFGCSGLVWRFMIQSLRSHHLRTPFLSPSNPGVTAAHSMRYDVYEACCCALSAMAASFAFATSLFSPCLPPCQHQVSCLPWGIEGFAVLTSHFANRRSISPRRSAVSRVSSFSDRRTTRAATAR